MANNSTSKVAVGAMFALVIAVAGWFVKPREGERTTGYADIVGVATACVGHTGEGVVVGKRYTPEQCREWFASDLGIAAQGVDRCVTQPMTVNQWAAFTSLAFNIGVAQFCRSSIARLANLGNWHGACYAIGMYVYAGGRKVPGLERRRKAEIELCTGMPVQPASASLAPIPAPSRSGDSLAWLIVMVLLCLLWRRDQVPRR